MDARRRSTRGARHAIAGLIRGFGVTALAIVLAACAGAAPAPAMRPVAADGSAVSITASHMQFVERDVAVPAGLAFTIEFDNQDGEPHNIAISDASRASVFKGEIVSATTISYSVPALAAGRYAFICEVHTDMRGSMTAQ